MVILIGNKVDLPNKVITNEMGSNYARENGWLFMEVSAKQNINIASAFLSLTSHIHQAIAGGTGDNQYENQRGESISLHERKGTKLTADSGKKSTKNCNC